MEPATQALPSPETLSDSDLKRYDTILRYLQTENQLLWGRSQHFLVAHAALLGLTAAKLPAPSPAISWPQILILAVVTVGGLVLALLWHRAITSGEFWTGHCHDILRALEARALGDLVFIRPFKSARTFVSARKVARHTALLFTVLWFLLAVYITGLACSRF